MSTYESAQNAYLTLSSIRFAYRLFGTPSSIPLVFNMHFRGTMDYWDPALLNPIAARRTVLLVDNVGVGASSGTILDSFTVWADYMVQIIRALGFESVDVFGFSMGGYIAQLIALQAPGLVRKLVIAGSGPSAGPGVLTGNAAYYQQLALASEEGEVKAAFLHTFFTAKERKQRAGEMWWKRMTAARKSGASFLTGDDVDCQLSAILKWHDEEYRKEGSYDRLGEITCPVLVAGGRYGARSTPGG
jgi:pimeloyl-ACP methyl ester carboxylesterase